MEYQKRHARKEDYKMRTHLIHGNFESQKWDYSHHVVPPVSHSATFRLSSVHRGAQGFVQFASAEEALSGHIPIYIYDRLDEPTRSMLEENLAYVRGHTPLGRVGVPADVVGVSRQMQEIFETAIRVAPSSTPVLITGETGVGKAVVARAIHGASGRENFVALNCAALPPNLVESELFGFKRGAFTDANRDHAGLVEVAAKATLFLDEVAEVPLATQPKLLRFLQDGEFRRLGDSDARKSSARVIAATNRDPSEEVRAGRMREDLFYRLNIVHIEIPPLRERPVDIPALAEQLVRRLADRYQLPPAELAPDAVAALTSYQWPGNIRELENVLARALALRAGVDVGISYEDGYMSAMAADVRSGAVPVALVDRAVRRILRQKLRLGLFETKGRCHYPKCRQEAARRTRDNSGQQWFGMLPGQWWRCRFCRDVLKTGSVP